MTPRWSTRDCLSALSIQPTETPSVKSPLTYLQGLVVTLSQLGRTEDISSASLWNLPTHARRTPTSHRMYHREPQYLGLLSSLPYDVYSIVYVCSFRGMDNVTALYVFYYLCTLLYRWNLDLWPCLCMRQVWSELDTQTRRSDLHLNTHHSSKPNL